MQQILVIDDDENITDLIKMYLEDDPYSVTTANSGSEAIELFEKGSFDIVITDIIMPEVSGIELIEKLVELKPEIKILACSGGQDFETDQLTASLALEQAVSEGAVCSLMKPFDRDTLINNLKNLG